MTREPEGGEADELKTRNSGKPPSEQLTESLWGLWRAIYAIYRRYRIPLSFFGSVFVVLVQILFSDELGRIIPAIVGNSANFLTSNTGIAVIGSIIIALQAWGLRLIIALGKGLEERGEMRTDGGRRDMPPRDDKGRFKSSGPSIIFVGAVVLMGYLLGSQYGETEAVIGALVALLILAWTDNL